MFPGLDNAAQINNGPTNHDNLRASMTLPTTSFTLFEPQFCRDIGVMQTFCMPRQAATIIFKTMKTHIDQAEVCPVRIIDPMAKKQNGVVRVALLTTELTVTVCLVVRGSFLPIEKAEAVLEIVYENRNRKEAVL